MSRFQRAKLSVELEVFKIMFTCTQESAQWYMTLLQALPTPKTILAVIMDTESSEPTNNCETCASPFKFQNQSKN